MKKTVACLLLASMILPLAGCDWAMLAAVAIEQKRKVPAEYNRLTNHSGLVYVWVEPETRFDYTHIQLELTSYVTKYIENNVENADMISSRVVVDYLEQKMDTDIIPEKLGNHFGVDHVIYIEILQFQLRDPTAPDLVQAKIDSSISVFDLTENPDMPEVFDLNSVRVSVPDGAPQLISRVNIDAIRREAYVQFAEEVSKKFYEYEEILN